MNPLAPDVTSLDPVPTLNRLESTQMMSDHISDEWLNAYSKGQIEEPYLGEVEEHLLVCESCCARLTEFDDVWGLNG